MKKEKKVEIRTFKELRYNTESNTLHGLAIPVDVESVLLDETFKEIVDRGAVNQNLINNNDIKLYANHQPQRGTLARSKNGKGSLKLTITDKGLEFDSTLPNTELGNEIREGIKRGDYDALSFGFECGDDTWEEKPNGEFLRHIKSFNMIDELSILSCEPAYQETNIALRSLEDFKLEQRNLKDEATKQEEEAKKKIDEETQRKKDEEKKLQEEEEERKCGLKKYYKRLKDELN